MAPARSGHSPFRARHVNGRAFFPRKLRRFSRRFRMRGMQVFIHEVDRENWAKGGKLAVDRS
jgi:hypothetical protein